MEQARLIHRTVKSKAAERRLGLITGGQIQEVAGMMNDDGELYN